MEERLTDLEIKVAYQDKLIEDLATLVRSFGVRLEEMSRELKQMKEAVRSPEVPVGPANEPPPHY